MRAQINENTYISSRLPVLLRQLIKNALSGGTYLNTSDFVRDAVKEKLEREGFLAKPSVVVNCPVQALYDEPVECPFCMTEAELEAGRDD